jgi:hypothetical protein
MKPKFVIAFAHSGRPVPCDWHIQMSMLQYPTNTTHLKLFRKGLPQDQALNEMTEEALKVGADYILTIDDDTQPPPSVILELMRVLETSDESIMACGGIYTTKSDPPEPIVYMGLSQGAYWNWKMGDIFPCWAVGNGCLMIRTKLFEMMPKPWYKWLHTRAELEQFPDLFADLIAGDPQEVDISPDIFFFTRLAQMGFKVLAHGGVLPIHHDVEKGKSYWMPANTPPTQGVTFNGQPFGWTKEVVCQQR